MKIEEENKTEYQVGETFQFGMTKLQCVNSIKKDNCFGCYLHSCLRQFKSSVGECWQTERLDHNDVIFIEADE